MRPQRILTDAEKETVNSLRKNGKNKKEIAKEIGCGTQVIIKYLAEIGDTNMTVGRKKIPISQKTKKGRRIQARLLQLYIWGYSTDKIAQMAGIDFCEAEKVVKGFHLFEGVNKDLTCKSPTENKIFVRELIDEIQSPNGKYPYLRCRMKTSNAKILYNQIMKDRNGNEITKFDIVIPCMKTIIVNTATEGDRSIWDKRIGDYEGLNNFFSNIGSPKLYFVNEGLDAILPNLESYVKFYIEQEMKFGHPFGFSDELLG